MPKVFFLDLGLRNFFLDNFTPFLKREDRGALLENAVFCQLAKHRENAEIHFWRTTQKQEVDFVIGEKEAFEVKVNPEHASLRVLKVFKAQYPEIDLRFVTFEARLQEYGKIPIMEVWEL